MLETYLSIDTEKQHRDSWERLLKQFMFACQTKEDIWFSVKVLFLIIQTKTKMENKSYIHLGELNIIKPAFLKNN